MMLGLVVRGAVRPLLDIREEAGDGSAGEARGARDEDATALSRTSAYMAKLRTNLQRAHPNKKDNFMLTFMDDD